MNIEQERAELLPCPFCGAGKTEVRENGRPWLGTKGWGEPDSVSVRHWCDHVDGQPSRMIERVGRDRAAAIAAWNRRAALQSQDLEGAAYESGRRCGLGFAHSVVSEILRKHYYGSGIEGLTKLIQQAADVIATEMDNPTTATTDIDHARRAEEGV